MSSAFAYQSVRSITSIAPTWARERPAVERWVEVDNALRGIAKRRAGLDADESRWLREAEALKIWRHLGMTNALDYMERVLGYGPRAAQDRLRVANALAELPVLGEALSQGELSFSAVRELSRVANRDTDAAWTKAARGKNLRQIEGLVAGHVAGDRPDDPADPQVRRHVARFELAAETFAALRQARSILDTEHHTNLTDDEFITVLANMVLEGAADFSVGSIDDSSDDEDTSMQGAAVCGDRKTMSPNEPAVDAPIVAEVVAEQVGRDAPKSLPMTRAKYQVAVSLCPSCRQGFQLGAGVMIPIGPEAVARAECDAQHIGSLDGTAPERAYQDVTPAVARFVWRRDEGRCQTPGCRSARGIEIHHVKSREDGGGHGADNLRLHCSACHKAQHAGTLAIVRGERIDARTAQPASATPSSIAIEVAVVRAQAKDALVGLGWKPAISRAAIDAALEELGELSLEELIREALRRCPRM